MSNDDMKMPEGPESGNSRHEGSMYGAEGIPLAPPSSMGGGDTTVPSNASSRQQTQTSARSCEVVSRHSFKFYNAYLISVLELIYCLHESVMKTNLCNFMLRSLSSFCSILTQDRNKKLRTLIFWVFCWHSFQF